jgi:hypothetical protein
MDAVYFLPHWLWVNLSNEFSEHSGLLRRMGQGLLLKVSPKYLAVRYYRVFCVSGINRTSCVPFLRSGAYVTINIVGQLKNVTTLPDFSGLIEEKIFIDPKLKLNSVALVRKRTIPTERPTLVGEVSANFCGERVSRGQRNGSPRPLISVF